MKPTRQPVLVVLAAAALAAVLGACGATGGSGSTASDTSGGSVAASERGAKPGSPDAGVTDGLAQDAPAKGPATRNAVLTRSVIATGELHLTSTHLADARQDAINLATGMRGFVADEQSQSDSRGRLRRVDLTLRVPSGSFEQALDGLAALGTVRNRQQSVEDVTTQVIDTAARVRAQKASVASIERLLSRATSIGDIISIERQLAERQAELDSLEQQQKWLADQTSLSTIQVTLSRPPAETRSGEDHAGFLGGLEDGWHALGQTALAVGTALGAALPFAAVVTLVGLPLWILVRRRRALVPAPPSDA